MLGITGMQVITATQIRFNSTLVRLRVVRGHLLIRVVKFQFHVGTIESPGMGLFRYACHVSIPRWYDWEKPTLLKPTQRHTRFNSTLVRLRGVVKGRRQDIGIFVSIPRWYDWEIQRRSAQQVYWEFQFHVGTIERWSLTREIITSLLFQFHVGTIERPDGAASLSYQVVSIPRWYDWESCIFCFCSFFFCFNSTLVRLRAGAIGALIDTYKFQFHVGTIESFPYL